MTLALVLLLQLINPTIELSPTGETFAVDIEEGAMHACMVYVRDDYTFRACETIDYDERVLFPGWASAGCNVQTRDCDRTGDWVVYIRVGYPGEPDSDHPGWRTVVYRESNHLEVSR